MKNKNWSNVENGIEPDIVVNPKTKNKEIFDICFVGHYMNHQRLDILIRSLKDFEKKSLIRINLIGSGLDLVENKLIDLGLIVVNHGFLKRSNLVNLISNFEIALIAGSPQYQSCMKLFDYGAAGCAVIAPNTYNLSYWFSNELLFFDGSPKDLQEKLNRLICNSTMLEELSNKLNNKIRSEFTWSKVFNYKAKIIQRIANEV